MVAGIMLASIHFDSTLMPHIKAKCQLVGDYIFPFPETFFKSQGKGTEHVWRESEAEAGWS